MSAEDQQLQLSWDGPEHTHVELRFREGDQPLPIVNDTESIQDLVIADIEERRQLGIKRYGTALQAFNGRDSLQDLYEELLDAAMYLKQTLVERDTRRATIEYVRAKESEQHARVERALSQ